MLEKLDQLFEENVVTREIEICASYICTLYRETQTLGQCFSSWTFQMFITSKFVSNWLQLEHYFNSF